MNATDDQGWTFLHQQALAGSTATVAVLLKYGADVNAVTNSGMTPLQLARSLELGQRCRPPPEQGRDVTPGESSSPVPSGSVPSASM